MIYIVIKKCVVCTAKFEIFYKTKKYCSASCARRAYDIDYRGIPRESQKIPEILITCDCCFKEFKAVTNNRRFCCGNCRNKWHQKQSKLKAIANG